MARASQTSTAELKREFDALKSDFSALTKELRAFAELQEQSLSARAANTAHAAADSVRGAADAARESGVQHLDAIRQIAESAGASAEDLVRERPAATVAGAAAIGFLVGALTAARR